MRTKGQYYEDYLNNHIDALDIPLEMFDGKLITLIGYREPDKFVEVTGKLLKGGLLINLSFDENEEMQKAYNDLFRLNPELFDKFPKEYRSQEMYDVIFDMDIDKFSSIPEEFRTSRMYTKMVEVNPDNFSSVPGDKMTEKMCEIAIEHNYIFYLRIPIGFRTQKMSDKAFEADPRIFRYINSEHKTLDMCIKAYQYSSGLINWIPTKFRIAVMYHDTIKDMSQEELQQFYSGIYAEEGNFNLIPEEFRTQRMWKHFVYSSGRHDVMNKIPKEYLDQKICDYLFENFPSRRGETFRYIPEEFRTKKMCLTMIRINFLECVKYIPVSVLDDELISEVVIELRKIMSLKWVVEYDTEIYGVIVGLYPDLIKVFKKDGINKILIMELYSLIENGGTLENIATKYGVAISVVSNALEELKEKDMDSYDTIKQILYINQNKWLFQMINDVTTFGKILVGIGYDEKKTFTREQKIQFAYLTSKYLHNSLEEIYRFNNYKKYSGEYYNKIRAFFNKVLNYKYVFNSDISIASLPETKMVIFNNSWLKQYDRVKFFGIRDGIQTTFPKYGKKEETLTQELEQNIVNVLQKDGIPLIDIIVKEAFREYFNGNLDKYIEKFGEYESVLESSKMSDDSKRRK